MATLSNTLQKFASGNPNPSVVDFLQNVAIPNVTLFGNLVLYGELFAGLAVTASTLYLMFQRLNKNVLYLLMAGLFVMAVMNVVFYFAAGWMSSSTQSINLLMLIVEVVGIAVALKVSGDLR